MTDAPIRAALRAACRDVCRERCAERGEPPCYEVCGDNGEELPWPAEDCNCAAITSAAIERFVRALPGPGYVGTPPRTAWITPLHMQNLADEVARAAEGEG
jgi:hypothetical protein